MLRQVEHEKVLKSLDRETRLSLAHAACIMLALNQRLCAEDAITNAWKVFSVVFPEKEE